MMTPGDYWTFGIFQYEMMEVGVSQHYNIHIYYRILVNNIETNRCWWPLSTLHYIYIPFFCY